MAVSSAAFHDDDTTVPVETMPTPTTTVAYTDLASVTLPTHRPDDDDDNASLNVGDASDPDDLDQDVQDADDRRRAQAQYTALPVSDDDDFMGDDLEDTTVPSASHRRQLGSALAQLPPRKQEDEDRDTGFDFFYDTPDASTSSSTALVLASTSQTSATREASAVGPFIGPANKGAAASDNKYKRGNRNAFTGLSNQGATCYMNSLLQTMFMTPELRLGLYKWQCTDDDEAEEDNIPFQLQKLFAKLETTTLPSISTKALTKSFGWTGADVFQQHDVQELCRVLFDALEKSFKGTVNETLVNDLYQGTMKDYVQCRTCGYESSRNDEFLDLSLVIRPFGSSKNMKSIEEAIEFFLKPEVLDGDNQWNCDRCKAKRDAIKGLKFSKLPYLLSLQLKRFDYDYVTDTRVKLHDQVTFPKYLDMNSYVHEEGSGVRGSFARKMSMERHELENRSNEGAAARVRRMSSMDETNPIVSFTDEDGVPLGGNIADTWSTDFNVNALIEKTGPLVYELYSVLIHSGSALGGHYYAYIKSFETDKWYDFNDSTVTEMSEHEVKKAWGGNTNSSYGGRISYSTCAYMLMYRLISREKNITVTSKDSIPQYLIERMREEEERHRRQELERAEMAKKMLIKFYMKTNSRNKLEKSMHVYKTATLREAHVLAHEAFAEELQGAMPKFENTRLRMYNDYTSYLNDSFEGRDERTLTQLNIYGSNQLYLEAKKDGEEWEPHDSSKLQLYVRRFLSPPDDEERQEELPLLSPDMSSRYIQVPADSTLEAFTKVLREKFDIPAEKKIRLVRKTGTSYTSTPVKVYNKDESPQTLKSRLQKDFNFANGNEVYFEECDDLTEPSAAEKHFEREVNTIEITVWHLDAIAEKIRIDRRETVRALKNKIANRLGLSVDKFKILRGNHRAGIEIKTIDTTLYKLSIGQGHSVYALEGTPLGTGEYLFRLMLHKTPGRTNSTGNAETKADDEPTVKSSSEGDDMFDLDELQVKLSQDESDLENVASIKVGEEMMVDDIRQVAWQALKEKGKIPADDSILPSHIRLRDLLSTTLTRILVNGCRLKEASSSPVYEGRGMVAQVLNEPETVQVGHHLIHVVYVDRSKWRFCKKRRFEFVVPKDQVGDEGSTDDDDEHDGFLESNALAVSTATRPSKSHSLMESNTWIPEQIALRLTIPPEQARFAAFTYGRDNYDICEVYKTDFDTWDRCMAGLRDYQNNYQLMVFVTDVDEHIGSFSVRERSLIQDFLVRKRDEMSKVSDRSYSSYTSNYRKPKETGVVIRTKASKASENKGGSTASVGSGGKSSGNAVNIRTSKRKPAASSDTDEEDSLYD